MKLRSLKYLTREGIRNVWVNRLMSVASVGVLVACMVLIGMAVLLTKNINTELESLEEQNVVNAYFNDENSVLYGNIPPISTTEFTSDISSGEADAEDKDSNSSSKEETTSDTSSKVEAPKIPESAYLIHSDEEAMAVIKKIRKIDNVKSVDFISAEEALEIYKKQNPDHAGAFSTFDEMGSPIARGAKITLNSMEDFDETIKEIENVTGVTHVVSQRDLAKKITALKDGITMICFWIIGILGIISLVIVSNTIRVTMYNRKLEISIMKAVGATDSFIRLPFIIEGMLLGLISALIAEGLLYFCYRVAAEAMNTGITFKIPFSDEAWLLLGIFAAIGIFAGALGSFIMIGKYLRKEGSEFKAL